MNFSVGTAAPWRNTVGVGARLLAVVVVFFAHFRPWQGGLLEEWGLVLAWQSLGWASFAESLELTAGRPLHLFPHYVGLALTSGGFVGEYAVLGGVAVAQMLLAVWALRTVIVSNPMRWALAVALALHPWWPAGGILRFLPAQFALAMAILWMGLIIRYLESGRRRLVVISAVALLIGFLAYQALLISVLVICVVLAATLTTVRRRQFVVVGSTMLVVLFDVIYTVKLAPLMSPGSYEASITGAGMNPMGLVTAVVATVLESPPLWGMLTVTLVVSAWLVALGGAAPTTSWFVWVGLALFAAPAAGLSYAASALHLNDAERIALPIGAVAWLVLCLAASRTGAPRAVLTRQLPLLAVLGLTGMMTVGWYTTWTAYADAQTQLLEAIGEIRSDTPSDDLVVVVDETGTYGDVYTLLPPYIDIALAVEGYGTGVVICTPEDVVREHPTAARFPIATTPSCSEVAGIDDAVEVSEIEVSEGTLVVLRIDR